MKKLTLIDLPKFVPREEYDKAISRMVDKLNKISEIKSIYQLGSVSDPGISDIDMLVIFEDGVSCHLDPRKGISKTERYLFVHNLFGLSSSQFDEAQSFTFFHGYNLLFGKDLMSDDRIIRNEETDILKQQIALEYLIKMYQTLSIQITYGIIKLRSILLEVKALLFDLKFLNVNSGQLFDLVNECIDIRSQWFLKYFDNKKIQSWLIDFHKKLEVFLRGKLITEKMEFYFKIADKYYSSRNVVFINKNSFGFEHTGITLPGQLSKIFSIKYFNLNSRFNRFGFFLPVSDINKKEVLRKKLNFEKESLDHNSKHFPYFSPLRTSLNMSEII